MNSVTIIGAGSWGCALARILGDNHHPVVLYDVKSEVVNEINQFHTNKKRLPTGTLPLNVTATCDLADAVSKSDFILLVVPTAVMRSVLKDINKVLRAKKYFINAAKGIEPDTFKRVSEIVEEEIDPQFFGGFVALTGPSHAEEVVMQKLTVIAAASLNPHLAERVQKMFSNKTYFRVYTSHDVVGAELGGALKNIYAIASGISQGLGYGVNAIAALITRGLAEMKRLAVAMGAEEETLSGLTGVGDMIVTCMSPLSRNYQAGLMIGAGDNLDEALHKMTMVVEGARTCISAYQASHAYHVYTPIIDAVYRVIYKHQNPRDAIYELMSSELKKER